MNKNKLAKIVDKYYFENGQHLEVDTWEMMEENDRDCMFDVHLCDKDSTYLFMIQNYNGLWDLDAGVKTYFRTPKYRIVEKWDGVKASCIPLYMDDTITLKTFKAITKEDIVNAVDYFVHEVLQAGVYFNINFKKEEIDENIKAQ